MSPLVKTLAKPLHRKSTAKMNGLCCLHGIALELLLRVVRSSTGKEHQQQAGKTDTMPVTHLESSQPEKMIAL